MFGALALLALSALVSHLPNAFAQGTTAFTYHGLLHDGAGPANGSYDLRFTLYDAVSSGNPIASQTNIATGITNGLFAATLDFGGVFNGANCWLELAARTNGGDAFTALNPRQPVLPAPYALYAANAGNAASAANTLQTPGGAGTNNTLYAATNGATGLPFADTSTVSTASTASTNFTLAQVAQLAANLTNQFLNTNIAAAKGDLAVFDGANWVRIAAGSDGQFLMASNAAAAGLAYSTAPGGGSSLPTNYYVFATNAVMHSPGPSSYTQVDGLSVSFNLPGPRDVTISFSISSTQASGYDAYQIFDGSTAVAPGNGSTFWYSMPGNLATGYPLNQAELTASTMLNLAAGSHTILVMFKSPSGTSNTFYDRSLQVSVH